MSCLKASSLMGGQCLIALSKEIKEQHKETRMKYIQKHKTHASVRPDRQRLAATAGSLLKPRRSVMWTPCRRRQVCDTAIRRRRLGVCRVYILHPTNLSNPPTLVLPSALFSCVNHMQKHFHIHCPVWSRSAATTFNWTLNWWILPLSLPIISNVISVILLLFFMYSDIFFFVFQIYLDAAGWTMQRLVSSSAVVTRWIAWLR